MCVYAHTSQRIEESRISKNCKEGYFSFNFPQVLSWKHFYSFRYCDLAMLIFLSSATALQIQRLIINETEDLAVTQNEQSSQGRREAAV